MIITVSDLRRSKVCPMARVWFAKHGLDWRDFVRNGIDADKLTATGDAIALRVVEEARGR
jgi:hypothetical protein